MKLILCDLNLDVYNAFHNYFGHLKDVEIFNQPFQTIKKYDCIVSPANSFGIMDGGFDYHITNYFGNGLMLNVQNHIIKYYAGEQPVGTSFVIKTGNENHKYLAHTPTMRTPQIINGSDNVYYAMKAMLIEVKKHEDINSVLCSGLGTLSGGVPADKAVKQMYMAYENVILNPIKHIDWKVAFQRENEIHRLR